LIAALFLPSIAPTHAQAAPPAKRKTAPALAKKRPVLRWREHTAGDETHRPKRGEVRLVHWGKRHNIPQPFHWAPRLKKGRGGDGEAAQPGAPAAPVDSPKVRPVANVYQMDQKYADLFRSDGKSEICGPSAMADVLLYLKRAHKPPFPALLDKEGLPAGYGDNEIVHKLFQLCGTSRDSGTNSEQLRGCASKVIADSGYPTVDVRAPGVWSDDPALKRPPLPADLRTLLTSQWAPGQDASSSDRGVVLLFGWYKRANGVRRNGGHFVALAGYDEKDPNAFYVSNPLIDYSKEAVPYSKIALEPAAADRSDVPAKGMWLTEQLSADSSGYVAVLENVVTVLPGLAPAAVATASDPASATPASVTPGTQPQAAPMGAGGARARRK
jgi:hypothetical protein